MITHIEIEGFKSLERVSLDLGNLNVFIGANASGKSNFLDALRVLQGIGYGLPIAEIFDGRPSGSTSRTWEGIRGGIENARFRAATGHVSNAIQLRVQLKSKELDGEFLYQIDIYPPWANVSGESLSFGGSQIYQFLASGPHRFDLSRAALQQYPKTRQCTARDDELIEICIRLLSDIQILDPTPAILREYSVPTKVGRMGERGESFAGLVKSILADRETGAAYTSWLKELTPAELDEVGVMWGALREPLFAISKGGHQTPAALLSDGTLRFAAIAAAFFQPDEPETLLIEEVENGLHPTRLRLLVELLQSRSASGRPQVMATSHSPGVVSWLNEQNYRTTFLCRRDDETGATTITPLAEIPRFIELAREQSSADLFAEGWLETAI